MVKKVIIVVTNESKIPGLDAVKTGWYLPEVAHPYEVFTKNGYEVKFISPKGKKSPMDEKSGEMFKDDEICKTFMTKHLDKLNTTGKAEDIKDPENYSGLFYAGGHGPMFDLPKAAAIADLGAKMYNAGKILGAVCHGTVGFEPIEKVIKNGKECHLLSKETVTSFTNEEEDAVQLTQFMPFKLETRLGEKGAKFVAAANWACNVQVSDRLVTGQNPASATKTAEKMVEIMQSKGL